MGISSLLESSHGEDEVFVSKGGFSRKLMEKCGSKAAVLLCLCYEGDNVPQSLQMASAVIQLCGLAEKGPGITKITMPKSWAHIQGAPFPTDALY